MRLLDATGEADALNDRRMEAIATSRSSSSR